MARPIRVLVVGHDIVNVHSWWRGFGPLADIAREHGDRFVVESPPYVDWLSARKYDVLWLSQPNAEQLTAALRFKQAGVPIVIDIDDLMTDVPKGNPARAFLLSNPQLAHAYRLGMVIADAVVISTERLRVELMARGLVKSDQAHVIENAWPDAMKWSKLVDSGLNTFLWRGSATHYPDIQPHVPELHRYFTDHPDDRLILLGWEPAGLDLPNVSFVPKMDLDTYLARLPTFGARFMLAPLEDNAFNACKSTIGYIEAAHAGCMLIAQAHTVYNDLPMSRGYGGLAELYEVLRQYANIDVRMREEAVTEMRNHVDNYMRLAPQNQKRMDLIERLVSK